VKEKKNLILRLLEGHRLMSLGTNRPDGWPQVTTVAYVNDGFLLYCFVARESQKHRNILLDPRVSIAISSDTDRPLQIQGLSLAGRAFAVADEWEFEHIGRLRQKRYPEYATIPTAAFLNGAARAAPNPSSDAVVLLRIEPELFSVIDYTKGFGHSDVIAFSSSDLDLHKGALPHRWDGNTI
jgi:general stress protein 26